MKTLAVLALALISLVGCSKKPTALEVCQKLEVAGVATGCKPGTPGGLGAAAVEVAVFDLPSVPTKSGQVMRFEKEKFYEGTVDAFTSAAMLAGPHRYGSAKTLIFVQMNEGASVEVGARAKAVVDALPGDSSGPPVSKAPPPPPPAEPKAAASAVVASPEAARAAPSPVEVCAKLLAAGVAKACGKSEVDKDMTKVTFDLAGQPGKKGTILQLPADKNYDRYLALVNGTPPTSALRPFAASSKARTVVHLQPGATADTAGKAKAVLEAL